MTDMRGLLRQAGLTYDGLARGVNATAARCGDPLHTNRSAVAHWVAGTVPAERTRSYIVAVLSDRLGRNVSLVELGWPPGEDTGAGLVLGPDPLGVLGDLATADVDRREFLRTAAYSMLAATGPLTVTAPAVRAQVTPTGALVGAEDVAAVRQLTAAFTATDERFGGWHGRRAVATYLAEDVTALCRGRFGSDVVRESMFTAAAQVAYLAGWKAHDCGEESTAQRYYMQGYNLAVTDGDAHGHAAYFLRQMAHHAMDINRPDRAVDLAMAAWDRAGEHTDPRTRSLFALCVARAYGTAHDGRRAATWLTMGERLATARADELPPYWAALSGDPAALLASHTAKTFTALGRHADAEPFYASAVARWNPDTHPRVRAIAADLLATTQAAQGHIEAACETWATAVPALRATRSARTKAALVNLRRTLAAPRYRSVPAARRLLAQA